MSKIRNYLLGGGIFEEIVALIASNTVKSFEEKKLEPEVPLTLEVYRRNVCKTFVLQSTAKVVAPVFFTVLFISYCKSWNAEYFTWHDLPHELFISTITLSMCAVLINLGIAVVTIGGATFAFKIRYKFLNRFDLIG